MKRLVGMFLPETARSLDEFIDLVLSHQCAHVEIAPVNSVMVDSRLMKTEVFDLFSGLKAKDHVGTAYFVACTAHTTRKKDNASSRLHRLMQYIAISLAPRGKKIVYHHSCIVRYVPHYKHEDDHKQHELEILSEARFCAAVLNHRFSAIADVRIELHEKAHHPSIKRRGVPLVVGHP